MTERRVSVLGVRPVHPGRGEPSRIELNLVLDYIKGTPIASVVLTPDECVLLIEQLAVAVRVTRSVDARRGDLRRPADALGQPVPPVLRGEMTL